MRAGVWFTAGAAAGVYGVVRVRRLAQAFTPDGMRDRLGAAFVGARIFAEEVAQGQADAETRLRAQYRVLQDRARDSAGRELTAARPASEDRTPPAVLPPGARTTTTATHAAHTEEGH